MGARVTTACRSTLSAARTIAALTHQFEFRSVVEKLVKPLSSGLLIVNDQHPETTIQ
jgi:hypothetical protein